LARLAGRLFQVDRALARALTHGFHSYAGRMHPSSARMAIATWSRPGQRVLDPYAGSGTVLVEAMAGGRQAVGVDMSPLAVLIARARSTVLGPVGRGQLVAVAQAMAAEAAERARKRIRPLIPPWAKGEHRRFEPHIALELLGLRELVMATPEDEVGAALRACFSSILAKFMRKAEWEDAPAAGASSRASAGKSRPQGGVAASAVAARRIGRGIPSHFFAARAEELALALVMLARVSPPGTPVPEIRLGDARCLEGLREEEFDLVVTSPPYAGIYDYVEHHDASFLWLGLPRHGARAQVGAPGKEGGPARTRWRADRKLWLGEVGRVAKPGATVVVLVGDGVVGGEPEDAAAAVGELADEVGLRMLAGAAQPRPPRTARLRAIFGDHPRQEHVLILRKS